ncbi:MAG: putative membrane protein YfcA [Candidatus Azotimanducaceae bacterium]|jgi:uncharacterized membrane protein YfcA
MDALALIIPGALIIGITVGLLGAGGSILSVPILVYLIGQDEKIAIAGSMAIVGFIALIGSIPCIKAKLVDWKSVLLFGIPGMIGTYGGAWLTVYVSGIVQLLAFATVMIAASVLMLRPIINNKASQKAQTPNDSKTPDNDNQRHPVKIIIDGLLVGVLTGFVGVGGGFLIVPALVLLGGLNMHRAIATSMVIIVMKSSSGFVKYLDVLQEFDLSLDMRVIVIFSVVGAIGSLLGKLASGYIAQDALRRGFGVFLVIMGSYIMVQSSMQLIA